MYGPCDGLVQDIGPAEICAAVVAIRFLAPPITLHTDCMHLVNGYQWGRAWCLKHRRPYLAAWTRFWRAVDDFGESHLTIVKVKGHATWLSVAEGRAELRHKRGNGAADYAAKRGALIHDRNLQVHLDRGRLVALLGRAAVWMARVGALVASSLGHRDVQSVSGPPRGSRSYLPGPWRRNSGRRTRRR